MGAFLLRRAGQSLVTLFLATIVVFFGIRALPGDPALALAGEERDPTALAEVRAQYGLDQPILVQYWRWLREVASGNLGESLRTGISVSETILSRVPVTLELALLSLLVAILLGVGAGVLAAVRRGSWTEWLANLAALLGLSVPSFWLGIMLILVFAIILGWLPASGYVSPLSDPSNPDATGTPIPFNRDYRVAGVFYTGMYEYDNGYVYKGTYEGFYCPRCAER